jgi:hypothetical protein
MKTLTCNSHFNAPASPALVFPLLCPVLEYKWLVHWRCDLIHSASGAAEEGCVFRTDSPQGGAMVWVVSRYEPPARIEFTCFVNQMYVFRLKIVLAPAGAATRLDWTHRWFSLGPAGDAWIDGWSGTEHEKGMDFLRRALAHYLTTGEMLRS